MTTIPVLHGIDLDMFGKRDPAQYGTLTLAKIVRGQTRGFGVDSALPGLRAAASAVQPA